MYIVQPYRTGFSRSITRTADGNFKNVDI
jgi:carboxypeptidase C (cathepsin A)